MTILASPQHEQLQCILNELGRQLGCEMVLDEESSCTLLYQNTLPIHIVLVDDTKVVFSALLMEKCSEASPQFFETLLEYQWFGIRTGGGALSWNPKERSLVWWMAVGIEQVTFENIQGYLENLVQSASSVRADLEAYLARSSEITECDEVMDGAFLPSFV